MSLENFYEILAGICFSIILQNKHSLIGLASLLRFEPGLPESFAQLLIDIL